MKNYKYLSNKIKNLDAKICIVGLGYVGLPLFLHFAKKKFNLIGYDKDIKKINSLKNGKSYISNISDKNIGFLNKSKKYNYLQTQNY